MKPLKSLSKDELLSFIKSNDRSVNMFDPIASCVVCDNEPDAPYHYCCDECDRYYSKLGEREDNLHDSRDSNNNNSS